MFFAAALIAAAVSAADGDSFHAGADHVRLWGIDAPELAQTCLRPDGRRWACGQAAKAAMAGMLAGGPLDCQARGRDRYNVPV